MPKKKVEKKIKEKKSVKFEKEPEPQPMEEEDETDEPMDPPQDPEIFTKEDFEMLTQEVNYALGFTKLPKPSRKPPAYLKRMQEMQED